MCAYILVCVSVSVSEVHVALGRTCALTHRACMQAYIPDVNGWTHLLNYIALRHEKKPTHSDAYGKTHRRSIVSLICSSMNTLTQIGQPSQPGTQGACSTAQCGPFMEHTHTHTHEEARQASQAPKCLLNRRSRPHTHTHTHTHT